MLTIKVPGFQFAGVHCGIKKGKKKDLAIIFSERPASAAALFTTNKIKAAPIIVGMNRLQREKIQAVVINSGNANSCTGPAGLKNAEIMCSELSDQLGIAKHLVIPSSTGVIGVPLPMKKVKGGIKKAAKLISPTFFSHAAEAIMTTDRFSKTSMVRIRLSGKTIVVAGMAKGAGMIAPNMATLLAYILTDAAVASSSLKRIIRRSAEKSFHAVTVDGDMSTNDTVLCLANGWAGNRLVVRGNREEQILERAFSKVMKDLALHLVEDGEGTTKVAEIHICGARSIAEAKKVAFAVANSKLVKTAFYGADPNVGRILVAIGYSGVSIVPEKIEISFDGVRVVRKGIVLASSEGAAARVLQRHTFRLIIHLHQGKGTASVWTSDLSHQYVRINSAYRS